MLEVARSRFVDISDADKVAELQRLGLSDGRIADDSVPRRAGPIGIVPAAHEVQLAVAGEVDQAGGVGHGNGPRLAGTISQQVAHADRRSVVLRNQRGPLGNGFEADLVLFMGRIFDHPFQPPTVAVGEILVSGKGNGLAGRFVDHLDGIGVQNAGQLGVGNDFGEVDRGVERHVARR